jgi:AraC family transcriptional activator of pobA
MKHFETIPAYYKAYGHTPPKLDFFDVRPFEQFYEEEKSGAEQFKMEPFRVEFYGIGLLIGGTAEMHLGKKFDANIVFYSPYQILSFDGVARDWKGYYIMFDQDYLSRCSFGTSFLTDFPFLRLDSVHPLKLSNEHVNALYPIFKNIHDEFNAANDDQFAFIEIYLNLILHYIKRFTATWQFNDNDFRHKAEINLVSQYQSLVERQLAHSELDPVYFSPAFYAEKLNIHPNHLNAVSKRVTNKTAKQIIHEALIIMAKSLLLQSDTSIKEIAFRLGFEEPAHFSNLFKKNTGFTPAQFRQIGVL